MSCVCVYVYVCVCVCLMCLVRKQARDWPATAVGHTDILKLNQTCLNICVVSEWSERKSTIINKHNIYSNSGSTVSF